MPDPSDPTPETESIHQDPPQAPEAALLPNKSPSTPVPPSPPETTARPFSSAAALDATLRFFANASNETLGACAVGLCASTYLVLGRVGLVLIGAVGGVVLHATWEAQQADVVDTDKAAGSRKRKELGIEVAKRVLDWRDNQRHGHSDSLSVVSTLADEVDPAKLLDYSGFRPKTKEALTNLTDAVIRDYVQWWYSPLLPKDQSFPTGSRQVLTSFILSFSNHLSRKRPADPFLDFLANSTSIAIVFLNELSTALKASSNQDAEKAIQTYLHFEPDSNLANVLSREQQDRKLNLVADDILQNFLDSKAYGFPLARTFLRKTLASLVLENTITTCSKPEWINTWIVYLLEAGEPELLNVIDAGVGDLATVAAQSDTTATASSKRHSRRVSKAEEAMEEAMREAQRLNEMIAEDEARRKRGLPPSELDETSSAATTDVGLATPSSSDSDRNRRSEQSLDSSLVFDIDGNAFPSAQPSPSREHPPFTNFDQLGEIATPVQPVSTAPTPTEVMVAIPLTLHNASITIMDLSDVSDQSTFKQPPKSEYLLQIEPASQRFPGWMVTRKFSDFDPLHETLRKIAPVTSASEFSHHYPTLPSWRGQTSATLIQSLEAYLRFALKFEPLAETAAMKTFLDKETGLQKAPAQSKNVLIQGGAALENVGKNFINVLGQGGKNIAGSGKAVFGGVSGVFGAVAGGQGVQKKSTSTPSRPFVQSSRTDAATPSSLKYSSEAARQSSDSFEAKPVLPRLPGTGLPSSENGSRSRSSSMLGGINSGRPSEEILNIPPPPSEISDDYQPVPRTLTEAIPETPPRSRQDTITAADPHQLGKTEVSALLEPSANDMTPNTTTTPALAQSSPSVSPAKSKSTTSRKNLPIDEAETRVTIDLIFAILTELYSLSSAWTIRLSLLSAAKTYLLRPQNPQIESIRILLQESVIEANFSDDGLANHINKLRENTLPTPEELAKWPRELSAEEKEALRIKARKLLVERGMPQALTSVMGQAASGEALGRVFDCLQVQEVARGLIFALLLQAIRATTQ
ncbi:hypothetical protein B0A52_05701 [Exophiala mesophila]|uniref:PXA domain-containing protein n=1 Tax=Exophiala mesophila TaxID=212818 RepID=A0A438N2G3_EXOME|nr:hypothetical protein B0A52_05701 [Exophiala mesophila]